MNFDNIIESARVPERCTPIKMLAIILGFPEEQNQVW